MCRQVCVYSYAVLLLCDVMLELKLPLANHGCHPAQRPHTATAVGCFFMPQHGDIDILCTRVLLCAQIECRDRRGLLSDIVGALKELPLQVRA